MIYSPGYNAGLGNVRQVVTVHDLIHLREPSLKYRLYYETVLRRAVHRAGLVFTVSETSAAAIQEWLNDDTIRIVNTGNGCSTIFQHRDEPRLERSLVYVGNMKRHKNFEVIVAALRIDRSATLTVVTPDGDVARKIVGQAGLGSRVTIYTSIGDTQLHDIYARATATVLPSTLEGFGLPALESVCTGTPVIYWRGCTSVAEIVGSAGIAVDSCDDAEAWATAFDLVKNVEVGAYSSVARTRYDWDAVGATVERTLRTGVARLGNGAL